jgi:hypothetical protein
MIEELIRPEIRSFIPYNANQQPYKIKLDANESPFNLPVEVRQKLADFIIDNPQLNLYPDTDSISLREAIAKHWDTDKDGVIVGTGSDQLIQVVANVFVSKEDKVLYPVPSFGMYPDSCLIAGGTAVSYLLDPADRFEYRKEKIIEVYDIEKPIAIELESTYTQIDGLNGKRFADTATGKNLDRIVKEKGLSRKLTSQSIGIVTITGLYGANIVAGALVASDSLQFEFLDTTTIPITGTINVNVRCKTYGSVGNIPAGAIKYFPKTFKGLFFFL